MKAETQAYLRGKKWKVAAFLDGAGATKRMQLYSCAEEPRLTKTWVQDSKGHSTTTLAVDGVEVADLDEAVERLLRQEEAQA